VPQELKAYHHLVVRSVTPARLARPIPKVLHPTIPQAYHDQRSGGGCFRRGPAGGSCVVGDLHASRSFALLGDSHAEAWLSAFEYAALQHHYRMIVLTHVGCTIGITLHHCSGWWARSRRELSQDPPEFLVLAQRFDTRVPADQMYLGLRQELEGLDQVVPRTVVVEDPPYHPLIDPTDCLLRSGATLGDCTLTFPAELNALYATM